jgi:dephospho-CoA kinase
MIIIGITGSIGAGKGTVVEHLKINKNFKHYSARALITEEIERRGLLLDRDSMILVSNDLREKNSPSFLVEELYRRAKQDGQNCIIESIRTLGEIEALRKIGHFHLLAVNADLPTRYQRVIARGSSTDNISFETFVEQNEREASSTDPHKQNISACIAQADFVLDNNRSVDELYEQIEKIFAELN